MTPLLSFVKKIAMAMLLIQRSVFLFAGGGTATLPFLTENLSGREMGMGGAFVAAAEGPESIFSNPSGGAASRFRSLNFSYSSAQDTGSYGFLGYLHPWRMKNQTRLSFGTGILYYNAGNLQVNYLDGRSQSFNAERSYAAALSFSFARPWIAAGFSPKFIRSTLAEQFTGSAYAADLGVMLFPLYKKFGSRVSIGGAIQNWGNSFAYKSASSSLPLTRALGVAARPWEKEGAASLLVSCQFQQTEGEKNQFRSGFELALGSLNGERNLFLRGGYLSGDDERDYTFGIGMRERGFQIDYAYVNALTLEKTHKVSLRFLFHDFEQVKEEPEDPEMKEMRNSFLKPAVEKEILLTPENVGSGGREDSDLMEGGKEERLLKEGEGQKDEWRLLEERLKR